jgi:hypothetical protein
MFVPVSVIYEYNRSAPSCLPATCAFCAAAWISPTLWLPACHGQASRLTVRSYLGCCHLQAVLSILRKRVWNGVRPPGQHLCCVKFVLDSAQSDTAKAP